ncbi:MAG TPA: hypothetical protein VNH18_28640 [Bryobacteraceae bacterium]|nr:hypothetical protein [Bryobacteraceae bacterium]
MRDIHRLIYLSSRCVAVSLVVCCPPLMFGETNCVAAGDGHAAEIPAARRSATEPSLALAQWIDALAIAESGNRDWIAHQDRDGGYNYGCLQFRERTFLHFVKKFKLDADPDEVMNLIYDCAFQKRLALDMLRDNPDNWKHWKKTARRIGLPPRVSAACDPDPTPLSETKDRSTSPQP